MDLDRILHFVPTHIEQIIAVLGALFLVTTILLLIRSLKEQPREDSSLDVGTIEGALKRVLAQNPQTVIEKVVAGEDGAPSNLADIAPLKNALAEKEKQLAVLNNELADAKAAATNAIANAQLNSSAPAGDSGQSAHAVAALEMEIADLKAKLAEYEIIEDDIADLALYKEENARLKREIEEARTTGTAQQAVPPIEANPAAGIPGLTEALMEEKAVAAPAAPQPTPPPAPKPTPAPQPKAEAANLGSTDTSKMEQEIESLAATTIDEDQEINALSDLLDTDKLLEEVNSLDAKDVMSEFKDKSKSG